MEVPLPSGEFAKARVLRLAGVRRLWLDFFLSWSADMWKWVYPKNLTRGLHPWNLRYRTSPRLFKHQGATFAYLEIYNRVRNRLSWSCWKDLGEVLLLCLIGCFLSGLEASPPTPKTTLATGNFCNFSYLFSPFFFPCEVPVMRLEKPKANRLQEHKLSS